MKQLLTAVLIVTATAFLDAHHHTGLGPVMKSLKCGWLEGENVHDMTNLATFCSQSGPSILQIQGVTANHERLWIDIPSQLAAAFRERDPLTGTLLKNWVERWKIISGYRTVSVIVLRDHEEVARAGTAMDADLPEQSINLTTNT